MSLPDEARLFSVLDATWAPAEMRTCGPWVFRQGQGGGQRVSATTASGPFTSADIVEAEAEMAKMGQPNLFMVRGSDVALDHALEIAGYRIVDPVLLYVGMSEEIALHDPKSLAAIQVDEPLAIMAEVWARGGIDQARLNVMSRVKGPKTYILGRHNDQAIGCAFVACDGDVAMLHALEINATSRRSGVARKMLGKSAAWALENGATYFAAITTGKNLPAQGLFASLGMHVVGNYHYRKK